MPQKQSQKTKGCKKCGRIKKKEAGKSTYLSLFVRNKISGEEYFRKTDQKAKA
jgi:hypothetical protein